MFHGASSATVRQLVDSSSVIAEGRKPKKCLGIDCIPAEELLGFFMGSLAVLSRFSDWLVLMFMNRFLRQPHENGRALGSRHVDADYVVGDAACARKKTLKAKLRLPSCSAKQEVVSRHDNTVTTTRHIKMVNVVC